MQAQPVSPAPAHGGWTAMEVGGLVTTGVLVIALWLVFRKLKFPE